MSKIKSVGSLKFNIKVNTANNSDYNVSEISDVEDVEFDIGEYDEFINILSDSCIEIPESDYVVQGTCEVNGYTLITAYDHSGDKNNSIVYVMDSSGNLVRTVELEGAYHVGGISYDDNSGYVFITGESGADNGNSSYVNVYNASDLLGGNGNCISKYKADNNNTLESSTNSKSSCAYLTCDDGYLYVGNFQKDNSGVIKKYKIDSKGNLSLVDKISNPYNATQGMCVYNYNGEDYYLFSCSSGRKNDSTLHIATLNGDSFEEVTSVTLPCMSEQVSTTSDGISVIFESGSKEYSDATTNINDVLYIDYDSLNELIDNNI